MAKKWKIGFGGVPTEADVRALLDTFGVPTEGASVTYEQIARVLHQPVRSNRWKTVTNAWRKRLFEEHNLILGAADGAFTALLPGERIERGAGKLRSGMRSVRRAGAIVQRTDRARLSETETKRADHVQVVSAALMLAANASGRETPKPALEPTTR